MRTTCWLLLLLLIPATLPAGEITVFAASSLTEALREVARHYQQQHPLDQVALNFAGSQTLAMQLEQGAPADLFISANRAVMDRLQHGGLVKDAEPLLGNRLVLAIRRDLPHPPGSLAELNRSDLLLVTGNPQAPVGHYTRLLFDALATDPAYGAGLVAALKNRIVSEESRVKAIIAKLSLGEADAGFVYQSDLGTSRLTGMALPEQHNPQALYPLAKVVGGSADSDRFYRFLLSAEAEGILRRHGFIGRSRL
jgi:molybdate transport system substrate-binding protein